MRMHIQTACRAFGIPENGIEWEQLSGGHIHGTFRVRAGDDRDYIVQRLSRTVFPDPAPVMKNIERVTAHLRAAAERDSRDAKRYVLRFLKTADGAAYWQDANGFCWRAYPMIANSVSYASLSDPGMLERAGAAFGGFQRDLLDFPAETLHETIPDFHNTPKRLQTLFDHARVNPLRRTANARDELRALEREQAAVCEPFARLGTADFPLRVTHNDTKCSNVLFDADTGEALAVIDLDTVMPGLVVYDFGDAVRSAARQADRLELRRAEALARGFLGAVGRYLTKYEREHLAWGVYAVSLELAARYLDDYLMGDHYFAVTYPEENLLRARRQLVFARDTVRQRNALYALLQSILDEQRES